MLTLNFIIKNILDFSAISLLLRIWVEFTFKDNEHPFANFIIKNTQKPINILKKIFPLNISNYIIFLIVSFLLMILKFILISYVQNVLTIVNIPTFILLSFISLIKIFNYLIFWVISIFILMNCFHHKKSLFKEFIIKLSNKIINIIKIVLPNFKNINYYSALIILILYLINYIGIDLFGDVWFLL